MSQMHYSGPRKGSIANRALGLIGLRRTLNSTPPILAAALLTTLVLTGTRVLLFNGHAIPADQCDFATDPATALATIKSLQQQLKPGSTGNIVLATAYRSSPDRLAVFVNSWAQHSPGSRLVIMTSDELLKNPTVRELYREHKVESIRFIPPPEVDDVDDEEELAKPGRSVLQSLEMYQQYLETKAATGTRAVAVVIEAGEVALQGDLFVDGAVKYAIANGQVMLTLEGGSEVAKVPILDNSAVFRTCMDCYGSTTAGKLGEKPMVSADVAIGSYGAMYAYVTLMADVMGTRVRYKCLRNLRPDLAVLAYVVHGLGSDPKYLDFRIALKNGKASPVMPIRYGLPAHIDGHGIVHRTPLNAAEKPHLPSTIVGYGAHPSLLQYLIDRYRASSAVLHFVEAPGYQGHQEALMGLPESWETTAQRLWAEMAQDADVADGQVSFENILQTMVEEAANRAQQRAEKARQQSSRGTKT
jgi:hypothetical protein